MKEATMNAEAEVIKEIFVETSKRLLQNFFSYQILNRERMGEDEIRNVMARVLEERKIFYEIETATEEAFIHEDNRVTRKALVDLVIYGEKHDRSSSINVELKRGHPVIEKIKKDIIKMFGEKEHLRGACFYHYLQKIDYGSIDRLDDAHSRILKKYSSALEQCQDIDRYDKNMLDKRWFLLFIIDASNEEYFFGFVDNMTKPIERDNKWQKL
jgi:hypothetical protein